MKKTLTLITALLLSSFAMAQSFPKGIYGNAVKHEIVYPVNWIVDTTKIDTLPVYMMISAKGDGMNPVVSRIGYSVLRRGHIKCTYLWNDKTPLSENNYNIWMSVVRKEP